MHYCWNETAGSLAAIAHQLITEYAFNVLLQWPKGTPKKVQAIWYKFSTGTSTPTE